MADGTYEPAPRTYKMSLAYKAAADMLTYMDEVLDLASYLDMSQMRIRSLRTVRNDLANALSRRLEQISKDTNR